MAFASAWIATQASYAQPLGVSLWARGHPPSLQWGWPEGGPLYPVERMRRFLTITEPCWRLTQLDLVAVSRARLRKYLSQSVRCVARPAVDTREIVGDRG